MLFLFFSSPFNCLVGWFLVINSMPLSFGKTWNKLLVTFFVSLEILSKVFVNVFSFGLEYLASNYLSSTFNFG
jgi:hypothetical protein